MDAPTYPPVAAFEQPIAMPAVLSLDNFSLAELMKIPAAWQIVVRHLPSLQRIVSAPMIQPHLGTFTVRTIGIFIPEVTPDGLTAIDAELHLLPLVKDPLP